MRQFLLAALLVPALAFAQSETELRSQIRSDLMEDPRTAQLSAAELDALVEALANEATETGEATTYLEVKSQPTFTYDPPPTGAANPYVSFLMNPAVIAVLVLLLGIFGIILFMLLRKRSPAEIEA